MPPQVSGPGPGKGPTVIHSQDGVEQTKSGNVQKKASEDATTSFAPHRATSKEKSQKNLEKSIEGGTWFTDLAKALGEAGQNQASTVKTIAKEKTSVEQAERLKTTSQELSVTNETLNSVVKTIGEAVSNTARK